jgi:hypothetical protein
MFHEVSADKVMVIADPVLLNPIRKKEESRILYTSERQNIPFCFYGVGST